MGMVDAFIAYKFIKILVVPWKETDAFKLGIIDEKGEVLKKRNTLRTSEEKKAYTIIHTLVWKVKRILEKIQIGKSRLGSLAAAMWFLKEELEKLDVDPELIEEGIMSSLRQFGINPEEFKKQSLKESFENDEVLISGSYLYEDTLIILKEDIQSFDSILGVPLFLINSDGNRYVFSKDELNKVSKI
jgi:hypothetical protein